MRKFTRAQLFFLVTVLTLVVVVLASPVTRTMLQTLLQGNPAGVSYAAGLLRSSDPDRIWSGAAEAGAYGDEAGPTIPLILEVIHDPERGSKPVTTVGKSPVRERIISPVGKMGKAATPFIPEIAALLADPDQMMRIETAMALEKLGPHAAAAVPSLQKAGGPGTDSYPAARVEVYKALRQIDKAALLDTLRACLKSDKDIDRVMACEFAAGLGADGRVLLPELDKLGENDSDYTVRGKARDAVVRLRGR